MKKNSTIFTCLLIVILLLLSSIGGPAIAAQDAIVRFHFFYAQDSDDCQIIKDELLSELIAQYGEQIEINYLDVAEPLVLEQKQILEKWRGVVPREADTPEIYIGEEALIGADEIREQLPELIEQYLSQGGVDLPALPDPPADDPDKPVARFLFFYGVTCPHCHNIIEDYLPAVYEKYGAQVESRYIEIYNDIENNRAFRGLELQLNVPPGLAGAVPALVIGDKVLVGGDGIPAELEKYIDEYLAQGGVDYPSLDNLPQPVEILIFLDSTQPDLAKLQELILPLVEQYGAWLRAYGADISQDKDAETLAQFNEALGISPPPAGTPQVLIGRQMLLGIDEIESRLPGLIEKYKAQGGIAIPTLEDLTAGITSETPSPTVEAAEAEPIYLAYFDQAGCQECARTTNDLRLVRGEYPQLIVETFAIEDNKALNEWLSQQYEVPEEKRLSTPMIFVGDDVLIGAEATLNNLMVTVAKYASTGAERIWEDFDPDQAEQNLVERFKSFGLLTVLGAGLIDGLNPCAFATLVFFISYLTFTGRRGRDVLFVGLSFALGVFLTYLLVGVGLLRAVQSLSFFSTLGKWVYLVTALLCAVLAVLTFHDFFKARKGQASEMTLALPMGLRRRIHKVIRESARLRAFVAVAFGTGFIVSLLELACTGQVYLPTIMFVLSVPNMAAQAFLYLLLYCLMFIAPLIVVFILSYFGTTSEQLSKFVSRHTSTIKLLTGLVFVGLTLWMTWTLAPLFGLQAPWNGLSSGAALILIILGAAAMQFFGKTSLNYKRRQRKQRRT
ncbi:MAG: hypothetical protein B6I34_07705 [Anaerolineaceae bacterium 4572_32.1]|nr:MAG: hypothetical protein B6I34_07705 [Anaerolineaceae bacterium 4572_32.1]